MLGTKQTNVQRVYLLSTLCQALPLGMRYEPSTPRVFTRVLPKSRTPRRKHGLASGEHPPKLEKKVEIARHLARLRPHTHHGTLATAHWHIPRVAFVHGHFHHHACGCSAAECARKLNLVRDLVPCSCPSSGAASPCGRSTNSVQT